jgi:ADP-heptose:LPS heptosyltransferase
MHIASAFAKPIVSVWGNTVPKLGMYPFLPEQNAPKPSVFEVSGLGCRPCSKIGFSRCPKGHFRCMNEQPAEQIASAAG